MSDATTIDISHESLLRQWQQLREWVTAEADAADELRQLVRDAQDWQQQRRGLLHQPELGIFRQWRDQRVPSAAWTTRYVLAEEFALADRYLDESHHQEQRDKSKEEEAQQRQLRLAHRHTAIATAIAAVAIISLAFAAWLSNRLEAQSTQLTESYEKQTAVLVKATVTATDENFPGLVKDLRACQAAALAPLREIIDDSKTSPRQKGNAALALAAFGDSVDTARPALRLVKDPSGRTQFIHGYPRFHGDLREAAQALEAAKADPAASDFRSGLCAALGMIPWAGGRVLQLAQPLRRTDALLPLEQNRAGRR